MKDKYQDIINRENKRLQEIYAKLDKKYKRDVSRFYFVFVIFIVLLIGFYYVCLAKN